jgi:hypothetical protein
VRLLSLRMRAYAPTPDFYSVERERDRGGV